MFWTCPWRLQLEHLAKGSAKGFSVYGIGGIGTLREHQTYLDGERSGLVCARQLLLQLVADDLDNVILIQKVYLLEFSQSDILLLPSLPRHSTHEPDLPRTW